MARREQPPNHPPSTIDSGGDLDGLAPDHSAVTRGSRAFLNKGGEGSIFGRRWKDVYQCVVSDLGGLNALSEGQRQLARRATTLALEAEFLESERASGNPFDLHLYLTITNAMRQLFAVLGLERVEHDDTPNLQDYIREFDENKAREEAERAASEGDKGSPE